MKIIHIINGLNDGGAEAVLCQMIIETPHIEHVVISLLKGGKYKHILLEKGIKVYSLEIGSMRDSLVAFRKLRYLIKIHMPDLVQTWMYHADILGGMSAWISGYRNIWTIHNSTLKFKHVKFRTIIISRLASILSYLIPAKIVYCAHEAKVQHEKIGYNKNISSVITNGYDLDRFNPVGAKLKHDFLDIEDFKIGYVGRDHPHKDLPTLIQAFKHFCDAGNFGMLFMCGSDFSDSNTNLMKMISENDLQHRIFLLGSQPKIENFYRSIDVLVLSSASEAFPNVLNEAMACGVPCISTDVGDCEEIVGDTGWIVTPGNVEELSMALSRALHELLENSNAWKSRCEHSSDRIMNRNSKAKMINAYENLWQSLVSKK